VDSSYKCGNELSGSINAGMFSSGCTTDGLSSNAKLHRISKLFFILQWKNDPFVQSVERKQAVQCPVFNIQDHFYRFKGHFDRSKNETSSAKPNISPLSEKHSKWKQLILSWLKD
jgi:hypothetical protein